MPNPSEPDRDDASGSAASEHQETSASSVMNTDGEATQPVADGEVATEVIVTGEPTTGEPTTEEPTTEELAVETGPGTQAPEQAFPERASPERRFTAPGFDAGETEVMPSVEPATEILSAQGAPEKAAPVLISPNLVRKLPAPLSRSWAWVLALVLIILAVAAVAVLATFWLTRDSRIQASREEQVRTAIQNFDVAVQNGDLAALRSLTCGTVRDGYVNYNDEAWSQTYGRIAAAKQYPVVASIDEVVVDGEHAEANVTAFMAFAPQIRSTRSFDLQYRDDQWKICQARSG